MDSPRLPGRAHPYSYRHTERFLLKLAQCDGDHVLTDALARWTASLWQVAEAKRDTPFPHFYLDGHRKPVYTESLIPRGLIGNSGKILGCRALTLLHDDQGHPRLSTTHRGDLHLTAGIPSILSRYEHEIEALPLTHLVVDREAMAVEFLAQMKAQGRTLTTILKTKKSRRTRLVQPCRSICTPHSGSPWRSAARGRSCPVCLSSRLRRTRNCLRSQWR